MQSVWKSGTGEIETEIASGCLLIMVLLFRCLQG